MTEVIVKLFNILIVLLLSLNASAIELKAAASAPYDFVNKGYAETVITVTATSGGKPLSGAKVTLAVESVKNGSKAIVKGWRNRITGLSWDKPVSGNIAPPEEIVCVTDKNGRAKATLTDIIGERTAIIRIVTDRGGEKSTVRVTAKSGKGPLSLFEAPNGSSVSWLDAFKACNGSEYTKDPAGWQVMMGYEGGKGMPTVEQLQSVAMPGIKNPDTRAMGAAVAAGWGSGTYWSGRALMQNRASHVRMADGNVHGTGGRNVYDSDSVSCLR